MHQVKSLFNKWLFRHCFGHGRAHWSLHHFAVFFLCSWNRIDTTDYLVSTQATQTWETITSTTNHSSPKQHHQDFCSILSPFLMALSDTTNEIFFTLIIAQVFLASAAYEQTHLIEALWSSFSWLLFCLAAVRQRSESRLPAVGERKQCYSQRLVQNLC